MKLSDIQLYISFHKKIATGSKIFYKSITNALQTTVSNIDDAPIELTELTRENIFMTSQGMINLLKTHLQSQILKSLLKVVGSSNIIGKYFDIKKNRKIIKTIFR